MAAAVVGRYSMFCGTTTFVFWVFLFFYAHFSYEVLVLLDMFGFHWFFTRFGGGHFVSLFTGGGHFGSLRVAGTVIR